jgi:hypothetical protein
MLLIYDLPVVYVPNINIYILYIISLYEIYIDILFEGMLLTLV